MSFISWISRVADTVLPGSSEISHNETTSEISANKTTGSSSSSRTILIVEDEEITQKILESSIKKLGYDCRCFSEANSALEYLQKTKSELPYLIISDLMMDEGDGIDLLAQTREDQDMANIPFVFLSGANKDLFTGILANYKYDGFLSKPINANDLSELINKLGKNSARVSSTTKVA